MLFYSTKNKNLNASLEDAIFQSLPPDNGLYMPVSIPKISKNFLDTIETKSFNEIALEVAHTLLSDDISREDLATIINSAYQFDAPVRRITSSDYVLELFHGPSMAFKDFGARFMAAIMSHFLSRSNKDIRILVATSGDTGGAVAQGFYKVPGISVTILYPSGKVSDIQEKQLTTLGHNVTAIEVNGTFDDCQRLVKEAFLDPDLSRKFNLASANSINIARLIPQSFYFFSAFAQLKKLGKPIVFSVPSGNFGNLSAGLLAYKMGLPVEHFIAATNLNDAVPRYLANGVYEPHPSVETISNAMDVGSPSNFVRMVRFFEDDWKEVTKQVTGFSFNDEQTKKTMREIFGNTNYVICPHTAVAFRGLLEYRQTKQDNFTGVFLSTAHPAKFIDLVEETLGNSIEIPEKLKSLLSIEKMSVKMDATFIAFKNLLMN
jgi:threonine synthase